MRPELLIVLALWVSCISSRGWGKQRAREQGIFEQSHLLQHPPIPSSKAVDAISAHDKLWKIEGHLTLDVTVHIRRWRVLESRDGVHMLPLSRSSSDTNGVVERVNLAQDDAMHPLLQNRHVWTDYSTLTRKQGSKCKVQVSSNTKHIEHIVPHDNVWRASRRASLLVIEGAAADKQANAVRRKGVDSSLLRYAGLTLATETQTGVVYDVGLPPSLAGIRAQVIRIIPATLNQVDLILNEFVIPLSASFSPSSDYVSLIYRKISSFTVYTLPPQYQFGGPVVGVMSSSSNFTTIDPLLPPGSIFLPANTYINVSLPMFSTSLNVNAFCAFFALNGSIFVSNLAAMPSYCLSSTLGDFALVIEASSMTSPTQEMSPPNTTASPNDGNIRSASSPSAKSSTNWKLIVGATCLALAGVAFLVAVALISLKLTESAKHFLTTRTYMRNDEALQDSLVGGSIAPSAAVMRTKPALEIDVAHFSH
ncbi:hypothetical protein L7F22_015596 [Adiantum nelumboides]|nr:hypothetical protein [Adiantum nelumboides]